MKNAEETKEGVDRELAALNMTLENIEQARPFEELTVDEVAKAKPEIDARTAEMVSKGRWMPAGYKVSFFILFTLFLVGRGQTANMMVFFLCGIVGEVWRSLALVRDLGGTASICPFFSMIYSRSCWFAGVTGMMLV